MSVIRWFNMTSIVIGAPILAALLITGFERLTFTLTCESMRYGCERSLIRGAEWMIEQVDLGHDVVVKKRK